MEQLLVPLPPGRNAVNSSPAAEVWLQHSLSVLLLEKMISRNAAASLSRQHWGSAACH